MATQSTILQTIKNVLFTILQSLVTIWMTFYLNCILCCEVGKRIVIWSLIKFGESNLLVKEFCDNRLRYKYKLKLLTHLYNFSVLLCTTTNWQCSISSLWHFHFCIHFEEIVIIFIFCSRNLRSSFSYQTTRNTES